MVVLFFVIIFSSMGFGLVLPPVVFVANNMGASEMLADVLERQSLVADVIDLVDRRELEVAVFERGAVTGAAQQGRRPGLNLLEQLEIGGVGTAAGPAEQHGAHPAITQAKRAGGRPGGGGKQRKRNRV